MATRFEIILCGEDAGSLHAAADEAVEEIRRVELQLSRFLPGSELSGLNAAAASRPVKVDPRLFWLLSEAKRICQETEGAFDITIAPLMRAWQCAQGSNAPSAAKLAKVGTTVGTKHLVLDEDALTVSFDQPGVELDLGAIGKGYAIERASAVLRDAGVSSFLIHGGTSTVYAAGSPPSGVWRVGISSPAKAGEPPTHIKLSDSAISVSAPHGRFIGLGSTRYGHILDPRVGIPVRHSLLAAVAGPSPTLCDALSTALLVLGESWLPHLERRFCGYSGMVVPSAAGQTPISSGSKGLAAPRAARWSVNWPSLMRG